MATTKPTSGIVDMNLRDFRTRKDLADAEFSGIKKNALDDSVEIWFKGRLEATVTELEIIKNPRAVELKLLELTGLYDPKETKQ